MKEKSINKKIRPIITTINHYNVFPFTSGGSICIRGFYKALSEWFDIRIISFCDRDVYDGIIKISDHISVYTIVEPPSIQEKYIKGDWSRDLCVIRDFPTNQEIVERVKEIAKDSVIVISEHVYTFNIIKSACPGTHIWYRAHNVERDFVKAWYKKKTEEVRPIYEVERECIEKAEVILTMSEGDRERFLEVYDCKGEEDKFFNLGTGIVLDHASPVFPRDRDRIRDGYKWHGFFIGTVSYTNETAANRALDIARSFPDTKIFIAGSVCLRLNAEILPPNATLLGYISDEEKEYYLNTVEFALNLVEDGAGVNIKMLEYFAHGTPVITSKHGARGIKIEDNVHCFVSEVGDEVGTFNRFIKTSEEFRDNMAVAAFNNLKINNDWRILAQRVVDDIICEKYKIDVRKTSVKEHQTELYPSKMRSEVLPKSNFYIRCAGSFGISCLSYLHEKGLEPVAFVDKKKNKAIDNIACITEEDFRRRYNDEEVIVSTAVFLPVVIELLQIGVPLEKIYVSVEGRQLIRLINNEGWLPPYQSYSKFEKKVRMALMEAQNGSST